MYEIKPWHSVAVAETEALFYADALTLAGIDTTPGPVGAPGTAGCVPAPGGWYVFEAAAPGAIGYWYRKATKAEAEERGTEPVETKVDKETLAAVAKAGIQISLAGLLSSLFTALLEEGWVLVFL